MRISGIFSKTKTTNLIGGFYSAFIYVYFIRNIEPVSTVFYALWLLMDSAISSNDALHGSSGSNHTFAVPLCMRPCLGQNLPESVPTGKIGNFNSWAKNSNPRFNFTF